MSFNAGMLVGILLVAAMMVLADDIKRLVRKEVSLAMTTWAVAEIKKEETA